MIRIMTRVGDKRVKTLQHNGKWITLCSYDEMPHIHGAAKEADNLFEAGQNHLQAASILMERYHTGKEI